MLTLLALFSLTRVPEPASLVLMIAGAGALIVTKFKKR